ncbi:MAG: hypothetical protein ACK5Q8_13525 [Phycisphaerales bacterium]|jgi:hypothetical protein|nr:hypothetical protein [Phycisphaeraceae bacterium]
MEPMKSGSWRRGAAFVLIAAVFCLSGHGGVARSDSALTSLVGADAFVSVALAQGGAASQDGGAYTHSNGTWSAQLPPGWKVMTPEQLAAMNSASGEAARKSGQSVTYGAGFYRGDAGGKDWSWVLVEQRAYVRQGALPEDLTPLFGFDQMDSTIKSLASQGFAGSVLSTSVDNRTGRGTAETELVLPDKSRVRGRAEILIGSGGTLSVSGFAPGDVWSKYEPEIMSLQSSTRFNAGHDLASASRAGGGFTSVSMGRIAAVALLAAGAIWIFKKVTGR